MPSRNSGGTSAAKWRTIVSKSARRMVTGVDSRWLPDAWPKRACPASGARPPWVLLGDPVPQVALELFERHAVLAHGVAVTHRDRAAGERVAVDRHTERRPGLVHPAI